MHKWESNVQWMHWKQWKRMRESLLDWAASLCFLGIKELKNWRDRFTVYAFAPRSLCLSPSALTLASLLSTFSFAFQSSCWRTDPVRSAKSEKVSRIPTKSFAHESICVLSKFLSLKGTWQTRRNYANAKPESMRKMCKILTSRNLSDWILHSFPD